jgi:exosortase H (IPTLxxWG-CTERM-specific)
MGMDPLIQGAHMSLDGFNVKIIGECSALYHIILLCSFVMAYPSSARQKISGLLFGIPVLWAGNIVRIVGVCLAGAKSPDLFVYFHVYFGQIIMILFVLTVSLAWLR